MNNKFIILSMIYSAVVAVFIIYIIYNQNLQFLYKSTALNGYIFKLTGLVLVCLGLFIAIYTRLYMAGNWSPSILPNGNHELITKGPYAFLRHPLYFGVIIALAGNAVIFAGHWILILFVAFIFLLIKIREEEKYLKEKYGLLYQQYAKKVII